LEEVIRDSSSASQEDKEKNRALYGIHAENPQEWGEAERIASRIAEINDVRNFSGSDWVWETLAVLESEGRLPVTRKAEGK
jgi:hypothetical protein